MPTKPLTMPTKPVTMPTKPLTMPTKTLVILESGSKVKKVQSYLGDNYIVKACFGHIRDIDGKSLNIDIANDFTPNYTIKEEKKSVVKELKLAYKKCKNILLATDLDREGEAIAFHIAEALGIKSTDRKRLIFSEITKTAIQNAVKDPVPLNMDICYAQQARRILDRLIGYSISPILWRHIQNTQKKKLSLSAGRVQSVVLKLIIEREKDIEKFSSERSFKITGILATINKKHSLKVFLNQELVDKESVMELLEDCKTSEFIIENISSNKSERKPPSPFITSTLQQEASTKFSMSPKNTMASAQKLYENGYITYMRTDSLNLSLDALAMIETYITSKYGKDYLNIKQYKNKDSNCQEAHEAIRPCNIDVNDISHDELLSPYEIKLYKLIWRRTVASQMSACKVELFTVKIEIDSYEDIWFVSKAEKILFSGFQKVYIQTLENNGKEDESVDIESVSDAVEIIQSLKKGSKLKYNTIISTEKISKPKQSRYTEASLIKRLDSLNIGRPSTYANMVAVVQDRKYVDKKDVTGKTEKISISTLRSGTIKEVLSNIKVGGEKNKLVPNEIGDIVNNFMSENFDTIINYKYTSDLEQKLDNISSGDANWVDIVRDSYNSFEPTCSTLRNQTRVYKDDKTRLIGKHPDTDMDIVCYIGQYGPVAKYNNKFAPLGEFKIDTITVEQVVTLFHYPKQLTEDITIKKGKYGLYFENNGKKYTLKDIDPDDITEEKCRELIATTGTSVIKTVDKDITINKGKFGVYIRCKNKNYAVYDKNPETLTKARCMEIMAKKKKVVPKPKTKK